MSEEKIEVDVFEVQNPNTAIITIHAQMATAFIEDQKDVKWAPSGIELRSFTVRLEDKNKEKAFAELKNKIEDSIELWDVIKNFPPNAPPPENIPQIEAFKLDANGQKEK